MLIPYNTDAPLYHLPIGTVVLIVINVIVFGALAAWDPEIFEQFDMEAVVMLQYGEGLKPWQWITSNFMHAGILHLLGNMFALWGFGLVIEGKIGWLRFILIYLGIGITQCAIEQTLMIAAEEGASCGASAIIFGLMGMAMIWAPRNEMNVMWWILRPHFFDISIWMFAGMSIVLQVALAIFSGLSFGSEIIHLMGASLGVAVGIFMLKRDWVDCEGWDVFSLREGKEDRNKELEADASKLLDRVHTQRLKSLESSSAGSKPKPSANVAPPKNSAPPSVALDHIREAVGIRDPQRAYAYYLNYSRKMGPQSVPEKDLLQILASFHEQKLFSESIPAMRDYLRSYTQHAAAVRLKLAQILIDHEQRPAQAVRVLQGISPGSLNEKQNEQLARLRKKAEAQQLDGSLEIVEEDW